MSSLVINSNNNLSSLLLTKPLHRISWLPKWQPLPTTPAREARTFVSKSYSNLSHDALLSDLWDYFEIEIKGCSRGGHGYKRIRSKDRKALSQALAKKECNKRCNNVLFSFPATSVYRHSYAIEFGQKLIDLEYRYCKDCNRIMPKSVILDLERAFYEKHKRGKTPPPIRLETSPILCPCCRARTARVEVLIRKTKMAKYLFEGEGY